MTRRNCLRTTWAALAAACCIALPAWADPSTTTLDDSLYQAWGQKPGIHAVMDDFVGRLMVDARTSRFFAKATRKYLVDQLTEQLCQQAGGPCTYRGPAMDVAHEDMDIGRADFNALVEVLQDSMQARGIPFSAQNRMLARLAPMHRQIIKREDKPGDKPG